MASHQFPPIDFSAIKARQRIIWSTGDYSIIGTTLVGISEQLCEAADLHAGESVLDVATGSGITAIAAARRFCKVTGIDYVPALLEDGRQLSTCMSLSRKATPRTFPLPMLPLISCSRRLASCLRLIRKKRRAKCCGFVAPAGRLAWRTGHQQVLLVTSSVSSANMCRRLPA